MTMLHQFSLSSNLINNGLKDSTPSDSDSIKTDNSMKTPLKFGFGGGKKAAGASSSLPNSANSSIMTKS